MSARFMKLAPQIQQIRQGLALRSNRSQNAICKESLSDGDIPDKPRRVKIHTIGLNYLGTDTILVGGATALTYTQFKVLMKLVHDKDSNLFPKYQPMHNTCWLSALDLACEVQTNHAGTHHRTIRTLAIDPKVPVLLRKLDRHIAEDRKIASSDQGMLHVIIYDNDGSQRSIALAQLVEAHLLAQGRKTAHTFHLHKRFWPCDGECMTCSKKEPIIRNIIAAFIELNSGL